MSDSDEARSCDPLSYAGLSIENAKLRIRLTQAENVLRYYAEADNTVRECVAGGHCANCELTRKANEYFL